MGLSIASLVGSGANTIANTARNEGGKGVGNLLTRGLRFDKGKDWWVDAFTGFGFLGDQGGGGSEGGEFAGLGLGPYQQDQNYLIAQNYLQDYGINLLEGRPNDYYSPIGEIGGSQFENYLQAMKGDVMTSALESSAAAGRAGGRAVDVAAQTTGKLSSEARYADYLRALEGRKFLMGQGRGITEGVRNTGQKEGQLTNAYNLDRAGLDLNMFKYMNEQDQEQSLLSGANMGSLVNMGIQGVQGYMGGGGWSGVLQAILGGSPQKGEAKISTKNDNKRLSNVNTTSPYEVYPDSVRT